jgi:hypothetical protein
MATVAHQFWAEALDIRRPLDPVDRPRARRERQVLVRRTGGGTATVSDGRTAAS